MDLTGQDHLVRLVFRHQLRQLPLHRGRATYRRNPQRLIHTTPQRRADFGVDVTPCLTVVKTAEPAARSAGEMVGSVDELVSKLKEKGIV